MMQNLDTTSLFTSLGVIAGVAAIYYAFGTARERLGRWGRATNGRIRRAVFSPSESDPSKSVSPHR